ncbi:MAG: precorrin-2 dehydrogenase/sirohydrochlorin ferrochelatase family protein, partial [Actinomycetota bacterium]
MPFGYPVFLELAGRRVVVIGETAVREEKVEGLLAAGAEDVLVVIDRPTARLEALAELDPRVTVEHRSWRAADLDGAFFCVASSDDPAERSS